MPGRNIYKLDLEHTFYHVYSRGVNKQVIFRNNEDYAVFLNLFKRHLSSKPIKDKRGRTYPWLQPVINLNAFCLMPNHFHALIYQVRQTAMTQLFKCILTTYGMYFNKKYGRVGPLFQSRFRALPILNDGYLEHISRYIHLNPSNYESWPYSSLPFYMKEQHASWLHPEPILESFNKNSALYEAFVADYVANKKMIDTIKSELANY